MSTPPLPDRLVRTLEAKTAQAQHDWHSPGLSVGVVRDGSLVWSHHVGSARLQPAKPPNDDTQFLIGSVTKTFTAVLVMQLRDEGKLVLDEPLGTWLPDSRHAAVTIRQLLAHSSGLQREPVGHLWESLEAPDRDALISGLEKAERVLPPHFAFHYSNLAYALLGQVVEMLDGGSWEKSVTRRVLRPLGMSRTGLKPGRDRAIGYQVDPFSGRATEEAPFDLKATAPLGGLWSTVADLARYAAFIADPDSEVLAPDSVEEMCRPIIMVDPEAWGAGYGLGFGMVRRRERVLVGHGGAMPGFLTGLQVRRSDKVGAVVSANCGSRAECSTLAADLVEIVLDELPTMATPWVPEEAHDDLRSILGPWWSEGEEVRLEVRAGELWMTVPGAGRLGETRLARETPRTFRAVEGRERGEILEVVT
ncbi:MAG: serine hydrolase domain-containing protein, partial [Lapillicoccus sp.]